MNCLTHNAIPAQAVCVHCGRGLYAQCIVRSDNGRIVCSPACSAAARMAERALNTIHGKTLSNLRLNGWFLLAGGVVFGGFALIPFRYGPGLLAAFLFPLALVFIACSLTFFHLAKRGERVQAGR